MKVKMPIFELAFFIVRQGVNPVYNLRPWAFISRYKDTIIESGCLRLQP